MASTAPTTGAGGGGGGDAISSTSTFLQSRKRFQDKKVVVTGAAMGIGQAIAQAFLEEGAYVAVLDREVETSQKWIMEGNYSSRCFAFATNVGVEEEVKAAIEKFSSSSMEVGTSTSIRDIPAGIDVLVNNAAAFVYGTVETTTDAQWDTVLNTNIKGYAFTMKYCVPHMKSTAAAAAAATNNNNNNTITTTTTNNNNNTINNNTSGTGSKSIVNISSISAFCGQEEFVPYSVTKAAVLQMTKNVAMDVGKFGIRVNCVCPGPILTEATTRHAKGIGKTVDEVIGDLTGHLILKRMGMTKEVANAVLFLASSEASFTTGSHLMVDGGYLLV